MISNLYRIGILGLLIVLVGSGCRSKGCTDPDASNYSSSAQVDDGSCEYLDVTAELRMNAMEQYADVVYFTYEDCYLQALNFQDAVASLVETPSADALEECREAWRLVRRPYAQSECFRFSEGPIDDIEDRLDAWLIDPSYVDYVSGEPFSGIIWDSQNYKKIDQETLIEANQAQGDDQVSLGFHVIEFLLWGQDTAAPEQLTAGGRSYKDFAQSDSATTDKIRRSEYLVAATEILVADIASLTQDWSKSESGNYRASFLANNSTKGFRLILTSLVRFAETELAMNRLRTSLDSLDTEREVSRFSDNSATELLLNTIGIRNVMEGKYTRVDSSKVEGVSVYDVAAIIGDTLSEEIQSSVNASVTAAGLVLGPLDFRLSQEFATPSSIDNAATELETLSALLIELGLELGYEIDPEIRSR